MRFADQEVFEQRNVPVVTSRATQGALAEITPCAQCGKREIGRIKPLAKSMGIGQGAQNVRTIGAVVYAVTALASVEPERER